MGRRDKLQKLIDDFRSLNIAAENENSIEDKLKEIFTLPLSSTYHLELEMIPPKSKFYRVRNFGKQDIFDFMSLKENDLWWNPNPKAGRFNKAGESILYCCYGESSIYTAKLETSINEGDSFVIIEYETKSPMISNKMHMETHGKEIESTMMNFVINEVMREVKSNEQYYYKITRAIKKVIYEGGAIENFGEINSMLHGFIYPSIKKRYEKNIVLYTNNLKHKIKIKNAVICSQTTNKTEESGIVCSLRFNKRRGYWGKNKFQLQDNTPFLDCENDIIKHT